MATVIIVRVKDLTNDGEAIDGEIEIVTDEVKTDSAIERYKEEWRKRLPLTTKAMGL